LLEDFTRGLARQQTDEREHGLVGLGIVMPTATPRTTSDTARSRASSSCRPVPWSSSSTHDNPALTSNDDLLLLNQLEAGRSFWERSGHLSTDDCGPCGRASCRRAWRRAARDQRPPARFVAAPVAQPSAGRGARWWPRRASRPRHGWTGSP